MEHGLDLRAPLAYALFEVLDQFLQTFDPLSPPTTLTLSIAWTSIDFKDSKGVFTPLSTKVRHRLELL